MKRISEEALHELARLFMDQFSFENMSLDDFLDKYRDELTDDERNLGNHILSLFDTCWID